MLDVAAEINILLYAIGTGVVACMVYQVLTLFQLLHKKVKWLICLEDMCYWIWLSVYVFSRIFQSTFGIIRWYIVVGIVLGVWATHTIWYSVKKVMIKIIKRLAKGLKSKYDN